MVRRRETLVSLLALVLAAAPAARAEARVLSLDDCIRVALERNHRRPASQFAIQLAEAQHRQALSAYWPQAKARAGLLRTDEAPNFIFPASQMGIPAQSANVPASTAMVTIPANAFGPGFPPSAVQMPVSVPAQSVTTAAQGFGVPAQNVRLLGPMTTTAKLDVEWLLYDGGMRKGLRQQADGALAAARAEARRTDLEVRDSVTRLYWSAVLARRLLQVGSDTLERMNVTLSLTESLYKGGSEKVSKIDYLDNKVLVETVTTMVAELGRNRKLAESALACTMGLEWRDTVEPSDRDIPDQPHAYDLAELVSSAYEFNPDWARLEAGLTAMEGALKKERSAYLPKIGLTGELHRWWNSANAGLGTSANKAGWSVGGGVEIPIFNGFLTAGRVAEARARLNRLKEEKFLLKEGIGLQLKSLFLSLEAATEILHAAERALVAARENRELTGRAYESELVETERVLRAQMMEALMEAQFHKARHDHLALGSQISTVVGRAVGEQIRQATGAN
jgi:outer membrane protein TolC